MKRSCHVCQGCFYPERMYSYDTCKTCMWYIVHNKKINHPQPLYDLGSID